MRTVSRLSLLLVLLIVLTAGCNGLSSGTSAPDREPYGVDVELGSSLSEPETNITGLTEEGVQNISFVRDHHEVLENRSYATSQTTTVTLANGTVLLADDRSSRTETATQQRLVRAETTGSWVLNVHERDQKQRVERYLSDEHGPLVRIEHGNGTVEYERGYGPMSTRSVSAFLSPLRAAAEIEVEEETYADGQYTVVTGTEPAGDTMFLDDEPFSTQAYIRDDGLIRYVTVEASIREDGERVHIDQVYLVDDISETTVERPDWYEQALEEVAEREDDVVTPESDVEE